MAQRLARFRLDRAEEFLGDAVGDDEAGRSLDQVCTGQVVRLIRGGQAHATGDPAFQSLRAGDRILEIIDSV